MLSPYVQDIVNNSAIDVIVALGLYITVLAGQLSAGHAALMGIGGYASGVLLIHTGLPLVSGLTVAVCASFAAGALMGVLLLRLDGLYMPIGTIAIAQGLVNVADNFGFIGGANGLSGIPLKGGVILSVLSALVAIGMVGLWERSIGGLRTRALGQDALAAQACGVNRSVVRVLAFGLGGCLAGYGGALQAESTGIVVPSSLGFLAAVVLFFYVGIGGITSYKGAVVGAVIVTVLPEVLRFSDYARYLYFGVALAVILIVRPRGLVPRSPLRMTSRYRELIGYSRRRSGKGEADLSGTENILGGQNKTSGTRF
jgi:branched-chain amino acid transport system permease protein